MTHVLLSPAIEKQPGAAPSGNFPLDRAFKWACLLCSIPVLISTYPPMVDMPQHAAQIASLRSIIFGADWAYSDMFYVKPFTPYWLGYGLVMILSFPFGIVWATKLVVAAALCLFPLTAARFCGHFGVKPGLNWILLILPYGFAYQWGFLNFIVAAPFGFLFLSELLNLNGRSDWRACLKIALWLHFLFVAHVLTTAFFCAIALLLLARPWTGPKQWMRRSLPVLTILPTAAFWLLSNLQSPSSGGVATAWRVGIVRIEKFLPMLVSAPTTATALLIGALALALPFLLGARPIRHWLAWAPVSFYVAWMLFFPADIGGAAFICERFGIFGLPFYFVCFDWRQAQPHHVPPTYLVPSLAVIALSVIAWQSARSLTFNTEAAGYQAVTQHAKAGKRVLMMAINPYSRISWNASGDPLDSNVYATPLFAHFGGWYQAEHAGLIEFNFARNWQQPLRYRADAISEIYLGFEWNPASLDWKRHRGDLYDYVLVRHPADASEWMAEKSHGTVRLLAAQSEWQLYGKN